MNSVSILGLSFMLFCSSAFGYQAGFELKNVTLINIDYVYYLKWNSLEKVRNVQYNVVARCKDRIRFTNTSNSTTVIFRPTRIERKSFWRFDITAQLNDTVLTKTHTEYKNLLGKSGIPINLSPPEVNLTDDCNNLTVLLTVTKPVRSITLLNYEVCFFCGGEQSVTQDPRKCTLLKKLHGNALATTLTEKSSNSREVCIKARIVIGRRDTETSPWKKVCTRSHCSKAKDHCTAQDYTSIDNITLTNTDFIYHLHWNPIAANGLIYDVIYNVTARFNGQERWLNASKTTSRVFRVYSSSEWNAWKFTIDAEMDGVIVTSQSKTFSDLKSPNVKMVLSTPKVKLLGKCRNFTAILMSSKESRIHYLGYIVNIHYLDNLSTWKLFEKVRGEYETNSDVTIINRQFPKTKEYRVAVKSKVRYGEEVYSEWKNVSTGTDCYLLRNGSRYILRNNSVIGKEHSNPPSEFLSIAAIAFMILVFATLYAVKKYCYNSLYKKNNSLPLTTKEIMEIPVNYRNDSGRYTRDDETADVIEPMEDLGDRMCSSENNGLLSEKKCSEMNLMNLSYRSEFANKSTNFQTYDKITEDSNLSAVKVYRQHETVLTAQNENRLCPLLPSAYQNLEDFKTAVVPVSQLYSTTNSEVSKVGRQGSMASDDSAFCDDECPNQHRVLGNNSNDRPTTHDSDEQGYIKLPSENQ